MLLVPPFLSSFAVFLPLTVFNNPRSDSAEPLDTFTQADAFFFSILQYLPHVSASAAHLAIFATLLLFSAAFLLLSAALLPVSVYFILQSTSPSNFVP